MQHAPMTERLIELLDANHEIALMLEKSIALAAQANPDPVTNPAQTVERFLAYLDHAATALPWNIAPWAEDTYSSLYAQIDETHAGTVEDAIPYTGNMALEQGKYYSQNGVTYLCTRDTGNPVYHNLADLVGLYVTAV